MKTFPMKCRSCGRTFECDGHCANLSSFFREENWWKKKDKDKHNENWLPPDFPECTCDYCKNRLVDKDGKPCDNHCEPREIKVQFD